jgi:Ca-activated chloride channel family protein
MLRRSVGLFLKLFLAIFVLAVFAVRPALADGLIVIHDPPHVVPGHFTFAPLEVVYHKVECTINDQVAVTSVDQEFYNPNGGRPLEGEYIFPVPKDANINKFAMDIDGKTVEAELLPADKARKIYEDIVRASKDPALLEYAGRAMFKVRIFPIEPNGRKRVHLKYTQLVKQDNGLLDYHYTLNTEKFSSKPLKNVSMKVSITSTEPITTLYSPTHDVEIKRHGDREAVVGFESKDVRPDTDFHLFIGRKATPVGINVLTYRPEGSKEGYFVLMASPTIAKATNPMPKDVVFVMDSSGSMSGAKIEQARKALKYCVETLNAGDRFEIVRFSTEAEPFFGKLSDASEENRKKAVEFALNMKAAGGTAIDEALQKAVENFPSRTAGDGRLGMIVFMTDGLPTIGEQNPDVILKRVKGNTAIRIFSFGVGNDVNTKLLDLMADQTRGYSQYVLPNENLELSMSNFWGKVQDPILAGLKLEISGGAGTAKMYPKELPDLFKGDQLVVFGTYEKGASGAVTLMGMANGKEQKFAQDVTFEEKTDSSKEWIGKLWATRRVGYLLDEIRLHGESKELKDEVVGLARQWGVVTPYTAMLIIEDERRRNVPVAQRSLREMETEAVVVGGAVRRFHSLSAAEKAGADAVTDSMNAKAYKDTRTLEQAKEDSEQHGRLAGNGSGGGGYDSSTLARGQRARAATTPAAPGESPALKPFDIQQVPNAGPQTVSGWQSAGDRDVGAKTGYRVVTNYAQQTRVINNRAFYLNGNQWTDSRAQKQDAKPVKIVFGSEAYFELLQKHPDASQYLSLGNNITVELDGVIYDIVEEVKQETTK